MCKMSVKSISSNELSLDSLDLDGKEKMENKEIHSSIGDTIRIPFYENDIIVNVEKLQHNIVKQNKTKTEKHNRKVTQETDSKSFLVNNNTNKRRKLSYLEVFRRKFPPRLPENNKNFEEISSISPECGDTERDSISDNETSPNHEFYETEAYNAIYYEKIMNHEIEDALNKQFEQVQLTEGSNCFNEYIFNNLKSISELTQPRRRSRRASVEPIHNIRLGGLGPDLENIKPRLERAKSLQRYSEEVRIKNRMKIYKKSVPDDLITPKKDSIWRQNTEPTNVTALNEMKPTYLVNKSIPEKKTSQKKSKSRAQKGRSDDIKVESYKSDQIPKAPKMTFKNALIVCGTSAPKNIKTGFGNSKKKPDKNVLDLSNVADKFLKSKFPAPKYDALKTLEEKHRMYQEKVKQFHV